MPETELPRRLRTYLAMLLDLETSWNVPQSACDELERRGLYAERGGVTDAGRAALSLPKAK